MELPNKLHIMGAGLGILGGPAMVIWPNQHWIAYSLFILGATIFLLPIFIGKKSFIFGEWVPVWISSDIFPYRKLISLNEAAKIAYEETSDSLPAAFAESRMSNGVINWYANALTGVDKISVYGRKPHTNKIIRIPEKILRSYTIEDNGRVLREIIQKKDAYVDLKITGIDMKERIQEIKSWEL